MTLEQNIAQQLTDNALTLAIAESCTGGLLTSRLTDVSGSSAFLKAGLITYSNASKTKLLKVPKVTLKKHGAVSFETATLMAQNVRRLFKTDLGIGLSGIAGPTGGTVRKPVGTVFIAVCTPHDTLCLKCRFKGSRQDIKQQAATQALELLKEFI